MAPILVIGNALCMLERLLMWKVSNGRSWPGPARGAADLNGRSLCIAAAGSANLAVAVGLH